MHTLTSKHARMDTVLEWLVLSIEDFFLYLRVNMTPPKYLPL